MNSTGGTEAEKKALSAEARVYRAWLHFYFVNLYGRPFHPDTAPSDPGFPIILTNDLTRKDFQRNTVLEVYEFIVDELEAAIPDLPTTISNRYRIAQSAGYAYLGKVLVFMRNYADAISALESAISTGNNASIPIGLYDYHLE